MYKREVPRTQEMSQVSAKDLGPYAYLLAVSSASVGTRNMSHSMLPWLQGGVWAWMRGFGEAVAILMAPRYKWHPDLLLPTPKDKSADLDVCIASLAQDRPSPQVGQIFLRRLELSTHINKTAKHVEGR